MTSENRTARLTILIDPRKKAVFERLCAEEDAVPSQVVRRLLRRYIEERLGKPWGPDESSISAPASIAAPNRSVPSSRRRGRPATRSR